MGPRANPTHLCVQSRNGSKHASKNSESSVTLRDRMFENSELSDRQFGHQ